MAEKKKKKKKEIYMEEERTKNQINGFRHLTNIQQDSSNSCLVPVRHLC